MRALFWLNAAVSTTSFVANAVSTSAPIDDLKIISNYWGQITPYHDNSPDYFGVEQVGLPDGCGIEQVHVLHRHAQRYPTSYIEDGGFMETFAAKLINFTTARPDATFTGPLDFLNTWSYELGQGPLEGTLTAPGSVTEFTSGVRFWNQYGRLLYNATAGQPRYNASLVGNTKPVLRTTSQTRILQSAQYWATGFFGFNSSDNYDLFVIPEGGVENNTLASYDSCKNDGNASVYYLGDYAAINYIPHYLQPAQRRLASYMPEGFDLNVNDTYGIQEICAYEVAAFGTSDFCSLFTLAEWEGFEYSTDLAYYGDYSYGNPVGRAQGIGYVQELLARLMNQTIPVSNSSVNSTLDSDPTTFPLGQPFYLDMSHDDILVSVVTALSIEYFKQDMPLTQFPPDPKRHFILSHLTPFGTRLETEVLGCASADPTTKAKSSTIYTLGQNGYKADNAPHKFIRMRW
ncbi:hypothetical protein HWV62_14944 [Athelia sp. TMB]|nr:hypothetical protein HWV62_14944 [Athelia sp. TMB]